MPETRLNPQVSVRIDPRIRERRTEVRRRERRRRLAVLVGTVSLTVLAGGAWGASRSPLLDVDRVEVAGAARTDVAEVVRASGVHRGRPLVDVDAGAAAARAEQLPWVLRATVRREWGGTVSIEVTEREPVAAARAGEGWALVDAEGRVLAAAPAPPAGLPSVIAASPVGPPGSRLPGGWDGVLEVAKAAPPSLLPRVSAIVEVEGGGVELALGTGGVVRMGPPQQLKEKFTAIETVLGQVETRGLAVLDVRVPRTPVLTRQEATAKVSTRTAG
ncbi:MAG: FtsQ-type POTRA domain-containing protein [Actinomycetota bacterium]|nr:FtsQ-type POTRA domain-containing protein [Actinomycetota bacterium]